MSRGAGGGRGRGRGFASSPASRRDTGDEYSPDLPPPAAPAPAPVSARTRAAATIPEAPEDEDVDLGGGAAEDTANVSPGGGVRNVKQGNALMGGRAGGRGRGSFISQKSTSYVASGEM